MRETVSIRVIHVAPTPFGDEGLFGGGERYPLELARALAGHVSTELVTFSARPRVVRDPSGLMIRVLRPFTYLHRHPAHPVAPGLPAALAGADIVHTHQLRSAPSRMAALTARARGQRLVCTDLGLGGGGWFGLLPRLFDRLLALSASSAETIGLPADRVRIIYGGTDPARFRPEPHRGERSVLFVGRLTPHKGVDRLIQALPPGARLIVAGTSGHDPNPPESGYPALLARLAAGRDVTFIGKVADDELPAIYRQAAVFVLPSVTRTCYGREVAISELLGLAVLEAMASGLPVICSRVGGLPEVVRDGETGFLVEPGNVEQLRDRIARLLAEPRLAEDLGRNGRGWVLERFTWDAVAHRCLDAYSELTSAA